jgi:hypothetical protein
MKVFKRSGSSYYAYKFQYRGKEYYRSTGTENRREAEALAAAALGSFGKRPDSKNLTHHQNPWRLMQVATAFLR